MDISSSLLAKGAAGTLAATAAVGTGVAAREGLFNDFFKTNSESINIEGVENSDETEQPTSGKENLSEATDSLRDSTSQEVEETATRSVSRSEGALNSAVDTESSDLPATEGTNENGVFGDSVVQAKTREDTASSEEEKKLTKFDRGLIDFLKVDGGDIVFEVKKGVEDITADNLTLDSANPLSLTARINVDSSNTTNLIEKAGVKSGNKGKRETLQKLNKNGTEDGAPWNWSCEIKFETTEASLEGKSINDKDKIFSSNEKGLFNLLKKNLSTVDGEQDKNEAKEAKEKFIRFCAKKRANSDEMKDKETLDDNKLESTITINLKAGIKGKGNKSDTSKLYPSESEDERKFKRLFDKSTQQSDQA